ncbi:MAG: MazG nucleotide pyrophosphohydrolase domain-containing protein [Brevinemataceae bacterium]
MKAFDNLLDIIKTLRSEKGCPWDKAQTLESLDKLFLEECYELSEVVYEGGKEDIKEELGDVFFMILLRGYIAEQTGICTLEQILESAEKKLIFRHPHVFGKETARSEQEIAAQWEKLKKEEKSERTSIFEGIPKSLPELMRFDKLTRKLKNTNHSLREYYMNSTSSKDRLQNLLLDLASEGEDIIQLMHEINKDIEQQARDKGL